MSRKYFLALGAALVLILSALLLWDKENNHQPAVTAGLTVTEAPTSDHIQHKQAVLEPDIATIPNVVGSDFETSQGLERLKTQILDNGSYISPGKRQQSFQASSLDTKSNAMEAKRTLLLDYSNNPSEKEVLKRVLALHFFRYSKHLTESDCVQMLDSVESQYNMASHQQIKRATQFDFGSVAYACARFDSSLVNRRVELVSEPALRAQAGNAHAVYVEELSNE